MLTPELLRSLLQACDCFTSGSGKLYGRCFCCQPTEEDKDNYKLTLFPGRKYPVAIVCFRCFAGADRRKRMWLFFETLRRAGIDHKPFTTPASPEEIAALWKEVGVQQKEEREGDRETFDPDLLHAVYSDVLDGLDLIPRHEKWLQKRGLEGQLAWAMGYRSTPEDSTELSKRLFQKWGFRLGVVPGFSNVFTESSVRLLTRPQAVLTPCRDAQGRVLALKQRMLDGGKGRHRLLAGGSGSPVVLCHVPLGVGGRKWEELWITEGERKADVHFQTASRSTVGIPGTGTWSTLLPHIDKLASPNGVIVLALDQDGKQQTINTQQKLAKKLTGLGYRVLTAEWIGAKGIDDAVLRGVEIKRSEWKGEEVEEANTPFLHSTSRVYVTPPQLQPPAPLRDSEILPYIAKCGPVWRSEIPLRHPCQQAVISRLIWTKQVKMVEKGGKGQLLEVEK